MDSILDMSYRLFGVGIRLYVYPYESCPCTKHILYFVFCVQIASGSFMRTQNSIKENVFLYERPDKVRAM